MYRVNDEESKKLGLDYAERALVALGQGTPLSVSEKQMRRIFEYICAAYRDGMERGANLGAEHLTDTEVSS